MLTTVSTVGEECEPEMLGLCGIRFCKIWNGTKEALATVKNISIGIKDGVVIKTWPSVPANNRTCVDTFYGAVLQINWTDHRGLQSEEFTALCHKTNYIPPPPKHGSALILPESPQLA